MDKKYSFLEGELVGVLTTEPVNRILDYYSPQGGVNLGDFVEVNLGPRKVLGCIWSAGIGGYDISKIKKINRVLDITPMRKEMKSFLCRVSDYTLSPLSGMLKLALRGNTLNYKQTNKNIYYLHQNYMSQGIRKTMARSLTIDFLEQNPNKSFSLSELSALSRASISVIRGLIKNRIIIEESIPVDLSYSKLLIGKAKKNLSKEQLEAAEKLKLLVREGNYGTTLLKGVTGSGKTEVYLEAVAEALRKGRQVLVLLPEIALTSAFIDRVQERFGCKPAEWHSGITKTEKNRCWQMVASGNAELIVGARSALYLPFKDLGLIVVDEEHDSSYKQEDGILYNARDMAVLRASLNSAVVILASATPSLETWVNASIGKYKRLNLQNRYGVSELPKISFIDMREEALPSGKWISQTLIKAINSNLGRTEQSLLFINRRGYAPITMCKACGLQVGCEKCDARMVLHSFKEKLMCHQCGDTKSVLELCPNCGVSNSFNPIGPGVERLAEEASEAFPGAKLAILSSDLIGSSKTMTKLINKIANGDVDIIIGTQLVAKGHNFPLLSLVGVIDADLGLQGGDLRAAEKTFQLIKQVSGRAGRANKKGLALLQTYQPEHPVMKAILTGDEEEFWASEAAQRKQAGVPPFGRMAGIVVSGLHLNQVTKIANDMAIKIEPLKKIDAVVYGPAPAPISRIRGRHRIRLLVKAAKVKDFQKALLSWVNQFKLPGNVRLSIDIDPQTFF